MKVPPFLVGAGLIFWGWQTDFLVVGVVMAVVLEGARFIKTRWEISNEDFSRIWTFCALLFLTTGAFAFTASNGGSTVGSWFASSGLTSQGTIGSLSTKTAVRLIRWLPMAFFLFVAAQTYSHREGIPLETISLILRRRWRRAKALGQPLPISRTVNVAYPYFITCLFAACAHPTTDANSFFWGLSILLVWALWGQRSRRFGLRVWVCTIGLAIVMGYGGQFGLTRLKQAVDQYNPAWLGGLAHEGFDPLESRTEIGQIGRIKTSSRIVIRVETPDDTPPPPYLREAAYRSYKSAVWYAGNANDDFSNLSEEPTDSGNWPMLAVRTNAPSVNIACYLPGGKGLLPLPTGTALLKELFVFDVQKNSVGAVRADGPGLVIFKTLYKNNAAIDRTPDNYEDTAVSEKEKPALDQIISDWHLNGLSEAKTLQAISHNFGTGFTYSLWQDSPKVKDTNSTAIGRFLLKTRSGHCEYFATATVLLLRELGIPARYTVGYAVHEIAGNNKYVIRQNDAHAWCRVWNTGEHQWEDFDTTPGIWMAMEHEQQSSLQFISDAWSRAMFEFAKFRWGQSHLRQYIFWFLAPVLALLLYQILFRSNRKRATQTGKNDLMNIFRPGLDSEFYQLEKELARRGFQRHPSEPLTAWLRRTAADPSLADLKEPMFRMLRLHYQYRFDPQGLSALDREKLRDEVAVCLAKGPALP